MKFYVRTQEKHGRMYSNPFEMWMFEGPHVAKNDLIMSGHM